jgi:hypothetical protein
VKKNQGQVMLSFFIDFLPYPYYYAFMKKKLKTKRVNVGQDLVHVETKIDSVLDTINEVREEMRTQTVMISQLPTKEEISTLLNLSQKLDRVREIIREKLHVEV